MKRIGYLKVICFVVILSCSHLVLAQDNWTGQAQCQLNVQTDGYAHQEIQTWKITDGAPTLQGAMQVYPGTWSTSGQGGMQKMQGMQALAAQWSTNAPEVSAPIAVFIRASDRRLIIKAWHAQLLSRAATQLARQVSAAGAAPVQSSQVYAAYEWQFPPVEDAAGSTNVSGTGTIPIGGSSIPQHSAASNETANCTWQFSEGARSPIARTTVPQLQSPVETAPSNSNAAGQAAAGSAGGGGAVGAGAASSAAGGQAVPVGTEKQQPLQSSTNKLKSVPAIATGRITQISPSSAEPNQQNVQVTLTGNGTHFVQGQTAASFASEAAVMAALSKAADSAAQAQQAVASILAGAGGGTSTGGGSSGGSNGGGSSGTSGSASSPSVPAQLQVISLNVVSNTTAIATINIDPAARGSYFVTLTTGSEVVTQSDGFNVGATATAAPVSVFTTAPPPSSGAAATVTSVGPITGTLATPTGSASGTTATTPTVPSAIHPTTQVIATNPAATSKLSPQITQVTPSQALQNTRNLSVTLTGSMTHFVQGKTTADFGPGITVSQLTSTASNSAVATITVDAFADTQSNGGLRNVTVTTGAEVLTAANSFTVTPNAAPLIAQLNLVTAKQGNTMGVMITGKNTHFQQGTTTADFGPGITVRNSNVSSPTVLAVSLDVDPTAMAGEHDVSVSTGAETARLAQGFNVVAVPATAQIQPDNAQLGQSLVVKVSGATHFAQGVTKAYGLPGVTGVTVNADHSASLYMYLNSAGITSRVYNGYLQTGGEVANVSFTVTPIPDGFGHSLATATPVGPTSKSFYKSFNGVFGSTEQQDCFSFLFDGAHNPNGDYPDPDPVTITVSGEGSTFQLLAFHSDQSLWNVSTNDGRLVLKEVPNYYQAFVCVRATNWSVTSPNYSITFSTQ